MTTAIATGATVKLQVLYLPFTNSGFTVSYVFGADGSKYALMVTDHSKVANFLNTYPQGTTVSGAD